MTMLLDLERVLELAAKHRARRIKAGDIEVEIDPSAWASTGPMLPATQPIGESAVAPTEEQILFWSSPLGAPPIETE
jgi:hypothetical protein